MKLFSSRSKRAVARKPEKKSKTSQRSNRTNERKIESTDVVERRPTGEAGVVQREERRPTVENIITQETAQRVEQVPTGETDITQREERKPASETSVAKRTPRNTVRKTQKPTRVKKKIGHKVLLTVFFFVLIVMVVGFGVWIYLNTTAPLPEPEQPSIEEPEEPIDTEPEDTPPPETTSPSALLQAAAIEIIDVAVPMGEVVTTEDFLVDVSDPSIIIFSDFVIEPDTYSVGSQIIEIAIEDVYNNREVATVLFTVLDNDVPPIFEGIRPVDGMRGGNILYRQGVSAFDAFGRPLEFTVENSEVDPDTLGVYTVTYRAVDAYGLITEEETQVHIVNIDPDRVDERIDRIFDDILTDDMTQVDQARAIFTWIKANVTFMPMASAPASSYEGAYRGLQDRRGGCTIFSALSDVMLNRAGIPTMRIDRVPEAPTRHRWNLINPDELGWYHFDAFPIQLGGPRDELYLFTAEHAADFTRRMTAVDGVAMYYIYDPSLYPEIVQDCNEYCAC